MHLVAPTLQSHPAEAVIFSVTFQVVPTENVTVT